MQFFMLKGLKIFVETIRRNSMYIIIGVSVCVLIYALIQERRIRLMKRARMEFDSLMATLPLHHVKIIDREKTK